VSNTFSFSFDEEDTGADHEWDFLDLVALSQDSVFYADVSDTPFIYQFVFNNFFDPDNQATEARIIDDFDLIPEIDLEDLYLFTKTSADKKEELGFGVGFNGVPLPIQYDNNKTVYDFPVNYGDSVVDDYSFSISVPGVGYLGELGTWAYEVDGWGNLITSFGSFDVLRLRIEHSFTDSIYIDSTETGIAIPRNLVIYEWLGEESGIPLLQITTEFGLVTSIVYQDFFINTGIEDVEIEMLSQFSIYPQPANDFVNVKFDHYPKQNIEISIFDLSGKQVQQGAFQAKKEFRINTSGLNPGLYMIEVKVDQFSHVEKLIIR